MRRRRGRRSSAGGGGGVGLLIITPFWLIGASKFGKERRAALAAEQQAKSDEA